MGNKAKRKIFISAHPTDRISFLEPLVNVINDIEDCVAVYNHVPNDKGPDIPADVDTFIIIASLKYFVWTNSGYSSEFFAAVRNRVRVIPILIETGQNIIDLINMRCGKIQYVDATLNLDFALDALRAHLTAKERIVDESLPSVFISYRRVDRNLLHDLVDIIEMSESFDKVNVWYDEIIVPGENYSQSILRQLKNCNLFILLITPNILEDKNYVWRVEYKTAKKLNKRILAIEAEKTDRRKLLEMYGNLGHIIDIKHKGAIYSVINEISSICKSQINAEM